MHTIVDYIVDKDLRYRPLGHSFGGTIIAKVAEAIGNCIRRLIFLDAFVLNDGESLRDSLPPHYQALFDSLAKNRTIIRW